MSKVDLDLLLYSEHCADGNCVFRTTKASKGGQHTNGGCHCLDGISYGHRRKIRQVFSSLRPLIEELRTARKVIEAARRLVNITRDNCGSTPCEDATECVMMALKELDGENEQG